MFNPLAPKLVIFGRNDTESDSSCDEEDDRDRAGADAHWKCRDESINYAGGIGGRRQSNFGIYHLDIFLSLLCEAFKLTSRKKALYFSAI